MHQQGPPNKMAVEADFFAGCGDANRYKVLEIVGKGAYGVVCSAIDTVTGEKVAIKKITNIFEHISDATRILREIKFLRLLRHPDIVDIKCIMMPRSRRNFREIYVVFELMDSDLHQVIKANEDLTHEHHRFFLYQMLRALKYMHAANVYHRDVKPKNILANANCKLKLCDFGLARVAFSDTPTTMFWTDYVATRWYRAPELCGSFFSKHTPAIDIWSIGCIFAEILSGKALFPGKNVLHQLDLITEVLGTPSADIISRVQSEKARTYLMSLRKKQPVDLAEKFPSADPSAIKLLQRLLAFHPQDRPSAEEALADPYFEGLAQIEREPSCQPFSRSEFEFERRKMTKEDIRELIFREILEYHPKLLKDYMQGGCGASFLHPRFFVLCRPGPRRKQFTYLDENTEKCRLAIPPERQPVIASVDNGNTAVEASVSGDPNPDAVAANIPAASWPPPRVPNAKLDLQHENVRSRSDSADEGICSQNTENDSNEAPAEEYNSKQQDISFDGSRVDANCNEQSSQPSPGEPSQLATSSSNSSRYYSSKSMECAS